MRGNQPINLDVMFDARVDERSELWALLNRDNVIDPQEQRMLDLHDTNTSRVGQVVQCIWTGMSWFRCLSPQGNRRTHDLAAQFAETYGPIAAD